MHAALHGHHGDPLDHADNQPSSMLQCSRTRKVRNFLVINTCGATEFIRKRAQARAQHQRNLWPQLGFGTDKLCRALRPLKNIRAAGFLSRRALHSSTLTIDADIRFAIVPASIARKPSRASSSRLLGASALIPPI